MSVSRVRTFSRSSTSRLNRWRASIASSWRPVAESGFMEAKNNHCLLVVRANASAEERLLLRGQLILETDEQRDLGALHLALERQHRIELHQRLALVDLRL